MRLRTCQSPTEPPTNQQGNNPCQHPPTTTYPSTTPPNTIPTHLPANLRPSDQSPPSTLTQPPAALPSTSHPTTNTTTSTHPITTHNATAQRSSIATTTFSLESLQREHHCIQTLKLIEIVYLLVLRFLPLHPFFAIFFTLIFPLSFSAHSNYFFTCHSLLPMPD